MLQVITHNGRPVAEGGKRIGYIAVDSTLGQVFSPCCGSGPTIAQLVALKQNGHGHLQLAAPVSESPPPIQFRLLKTRSHTGYCMECFAPVPDRLGRLTVTDEGEKMLFDCPDCGLTLRNRSHFS